MGLVTPVPAGLARPLVESLRNEQRRHVIPGLQLDLCRRLTAEAVGTAFNDLLASAAPHVSSAAPDNATQAPAEADVLARLAELPTLDITDREVEAEGAATLMTAPEPAVEVAAEDLEHDDGFIAPTMLTFENGARVVLNSTEIADNDVYLSHEPRWPVAGGRSGRSGGSIAVEVVTSSGIGDLDAVELDTCLSGAAIELYPSIDQTSEDFTGHRRPMISSCCCSWSTCTCRRHDSIIPRSNPASAHAVVRRRSEQRSCSCRVHRLSEARWGPSLASG